MFICTKHHLYLPLCSIHLWWLWRYEHLYVDYSLISKILLSSKLQSIFPTWCCSHYHTVFCDPHLYWTDASLLQASSIFLWPWQLDGSLPVYMLHNFCVIWFTVWMSMSRFFAVAVWCTHHVACVARSGVFFEEVACWHWSICSNVFAHFANFYEIDNTFCYVCHILWPNILYDFFSTSEWQVHMWLNFGIWTISAHLTLEIFSFQQQQLIFNFTWIHYKCIELQK